LTRRQLQWWDERDIISPAQQDRRRIYSSSDVIAMMVIADLRRKGFSLQKIRVIVRSVRRQIERRLDLLLAGESEVYLMTDGQHSYLADQPPRVVELLKTSSKPLILVSVSDHADRLAQYQQQLARRNRNRDEQNQLKLF
jgi:DNA-binding transcriptional MerR regulator